MDNNARIRFEEDFVKNNVQNDAHSINYTLDQIHEVHSEEYGWVVGTPSITPNPDGKTVTIKVHLTQYEMTNSNRRAL